MSLWDAVVLWMGRAIGEFVGGLALILGFLALIVGCYFAALLGYTIRRRFLKWRNR